MTKYQLFFKKKALQELIVLPLIEQVGFLRLIKKIARNPFQVGMKLLPGFTNIFRLQINNMKVIYQIEDYEGKVVIWAV